MLFGVGKLGAKAKSGAVAVDTTGPEASTFAFDLSKAEPTNDFVGSYHDASTTIEMGDITFNSDGTKLFYTNIDDDTKLHEISLSTAYDVKTATGSITTHTLTHDAVGITFADSGTKFYTFNRSGSAARKIVRYNLSTAYDMTTATFSQLSPATNTISGGYSPSNFIEINPTGTRIFLRSTGGDVYQHTLNPAFSVTNIPFQSGTVDLGYSAVSSNVCFSSDGTKIYYSNLGEFFERTMSTAYDVSTAGSESSSGFRTVIDSGLYPNALNVSPDGTKFYVSNGASIFQSPVLTTGDITTVYFDATKRFYNSSITFGRGIFFKDDGTKMYLVNNTGIIYEVDLSVAWDIASGNDDATLAQLDVSSQESQTYDVFIKPDGLELYIIGTSGDDVTQFTLSTAWDVTSATFTRNFDVSAKEPSPQGVTFSDDGTNMYICGSSSDNIHQYTLSTAWDISTASFAGTATKPTDQFFLNGLTLNDDGTKIFCVASFSSVTIREFTMSTPYDITTASQTHAFRIEQDEYNPFMAPSGLFYKPDGTRFFVHGRTGVSEFATDDKKMVEQIYSPAINVILSTAETGGSGDYTGDYDVLDVEFIPDDLPSDFSGRLYIGHKLRGKNNFDLCIGAVQILNSSEARVHAWQGSDFTNWDTTASDALTLPSSYTDVTGYSYLSIASGSSSLRWNVASSTGTSSTGAADGVSTTYGSGGSAVLPVRGLSQVSQTASTNFCYTETSNSGLANGDYIWMRSPSVTLSSATLHHLRIAYNLTSLDGSADGTAKTYDTLQVFWSGTE